MFAYMRCYDAFAVYMEATKEFGKKPLFSLETCNSETIIHLPYASIIVTPRRVLLDEKTLKRDHLLDEQENWDISETAARAPED